MGPRTRSQKAVRGQGTGLVPPRLALAIPRLSYPVAVKARRRAKATRRSEAHGQRSGR